MLYKFFKKMLLVIIIIMVLINSSYCEELNCQIDLNNDGVLEKIWLTQTNHAKKLYTQRWNLKIFDGKTGKNLFIQPTEVGTFSKPINIKKINGKLYITQGRIYQKINPIAVTIYSLDNSTGRYLEEKELIISVKKNTKFDKVFALAVKNNGQEIDLTGIRNLRIVLILEKQGKLNKKLINKFFNIKQSLGGNPILSLQSDAYKKIKMLKISYLNINLAEIKSIDIINLYFVNGRDRYVKFDKSGNIYQYETNLEDN